MVGTESITIALPDAVLDVIVERGAEQVAMRLRPAAEPWVGVEDVAAHLSCRRHRVYDLVCRLHVTGIPHRKDGARPAVHALADRRVDRERRRRMSAARVLPPSTLRLVSVPITETDMPIKKLPSGSVSVAPLTACRAPQPPASAPA